MKHDIFAKWLKALIVGTIIIGIACCILVIPYIGDFLKIQYPQATHLIKPWTITIYICLIPCFLSMLLCWKIADNIGNGQYFCAANARLFHTFSMMALGDSIFFLFVCAVFFFLGINHIEMIFADLLIFFIGMAVYIITSALSYFTANAAILQEDNDLTI